MKKKLLAALLAAVLVLSGLFAVIGIADDFGGIAGDNDFGGGDYGGGGGDYDGGWDSDDDDNYYYGSGYSSSDSGGGGGGLIAGVFFLVLIIVIIAIVSDKKKHASGNVNSGGYRPQGAIPTSMADLNPMADYFKADPAFSEAAFKEKLANLYVRLQDAWHNKELSPLRPYLSDALYAQSDRQLDEHRRKGETSYIERIAVQDVSLTGWRQEQDRDVIIARLHTRITTYILNDATGQLVRGSRTAEKFMEYEWSLSRSVNRRGQSGDSAVVHNCPNCGAPLNINRTAKCEYCDSIITVDSYDWVLTSIKGISQRTVG